MKQHVLAAAVLATMGISLAACNSSSNNDDPPAPTNGAASDCFNPKDFDIGTTWQLVYGESDSPALETVTGKVIGMDTFEGYQALKTSLSTQRQSAPDQPPSPTDISYQYAKLLDNMLVERYGELQESATDGNIYTLYDPPIKADLYNLANNQTEHLKLDEITWVDDGPRSTETTELSFTYRGQETITIQAGIFVACKFDATTLYDGAELTSQTWYDTDTGVVLKTVNDAMTSELIKGTYNGVEIK